GGPIPNCPVPIPLLLPPHHPQRRARAAVLGESPLSYNHTFSKSNPLRQITKKRGRCPLKPLLQVQYLHLEQLWSELAPSGCPIRLLVANRRKTKTRSWSKKRPTGLTDLGKMVNNDLLSRPK